MANFQYAGLDASGKAVSGTIDAANSQDAISKLKNMGYYITSIVAGKSGQKIKDTSAKQPAKKTTSQKKSSGGGISINIPFLGGNKIKPKELTVITRQLATLIGSGLPLLRALKVLEQQRKGGAAKILNKVAAEIEQGALFSEALAKFPSSFPRIYVAMVKAGEAGGALESVLSRLAEFMEKEAKLKALQLTMDKLEKTYGKGSVQLLYDLSDGSSVHVTAAKWLTPSRRAIDGVGLMPDEVIARGTGSDDPQLQRAMQLLVGN